MGASALTTALAAVLALSPATAAAPAPHGWSCHDGAAGPGGSGVLSSLRVSASGAVTDSSLDWSPPRRGEPAAAPPQSPSLRLDLDFAYAGPDRPDRLNVAEPRSVGFGLVLHMAPDGKSPLPVDVSAKAWVEIIADGRRLERLPWKDFDQMLSRVTAARLTHADLTYVEGFRRLPAKDFKVLNAAQTIELRAVDGAGHVLALSEFASGDRSALGPLAKSATDRVFADVAHPNEKCMRDDVMIVG
jgi:hypothetical protein